MASVTGDTRQLPASPPPAAEPSPARHASVAWWLAAVVVAASLSVVVTWPLALHMGQLWSVRLPGIQQGQLAAPPAGSFPGNDALQTMHVNQVVIDNALHLREPFLDLVSGAAGPEPLRTSSLDLPWTPVEALLLPLVGLVAAYNTVVLLSSVLAVLCAFGLLRRHTRLPLLALAGALVYAFVTGRVFQLSLHFNALLWAAFPAAAWALEVMLERHRDGPVALGGLAATTGSARRWLVPGLWLALVTVVVALSGEYHHSLYLSGMIGFLVVWQLVAAAVGRKPLPLGPAALALGAVVVADAYVLATFRWVFGDSVAGTNGQYAEAIRYAPRGLGALVHKSLGELGEGLVYLGWPVTLLALAGAVVAVAGRRRAGKAAVGNTALSEAAYAVLAVPVLFLTLGPAADQALQRILARVGLPHHVELYRHLFDLVPFLALQRVTARLLVLAALLLVLLAVVAVDAAVTWLAQGPLPAVSRRLPGGAARGGRTVAVAGTAALVLPTALLLHDYRVFRSVLRPAQTSNQVTVALKAGGDQAGPFLGLPMYGPTYPWNAASPYLASQTGRRTLNAYNQSPAAWLEARSATLGSLTWGQVDDNALAMLRSTGTRQVVVMDEPHVYCCGHSWREAVDRLLASGHFRLVVDDPPFALLELVA